MHTWQILVYYIQLLIITTTFHSMRGGGELGMDDDLAIDP